MPWTRASSLDRALACPASTHLPQADAQSIAAKTAAEWGTKLHEWKETGTWFSGKPWERRKAALSAAGMTREMLWPSSSGHEISYALNTYDKCVRRFESSSKEEREAWKASHDHLWITGTADYVGQYFDAAWVDDLKTTSKDWFDPNPWNHWQLRFYAVCVALDTGADVVRVTLTHWPRYPADGTPQRYEHYVDRDELLGHTLPLLEYARLSAVSSATDVSANAVPGSHCKFCPSFSACPAQNGGLY